MLDGMLALALGTLSLRGTVAFVSVPASCPAGTPERVVCHARTGDGVVPGLGRVTEIYLYMADNLPCPSGWKVLGTLVRLTVAGKGEILLMTAETPDCIPDLAVPRATQAFTVTGGTGMYGGAAGSGMITRAAGLPGARVVGIDTLTGTLSVPGVEFDVTPPRISGARSRAFRTRRAALRVTYNLTARDDQDGVVPVTCRPPSGSRFRVGRTRVACAATDSSGNTATARFTITVRR